VLFRVRVRIGGLLFFILDFSLLLSWSILNHAMLKVEIVLMLDSYSLLFGGRVSIISGLIFIYSLGYMSEEKFFLRFHVILIRFVSSMLMLIFRVNLISLLLGWDGLGVTSYLLVVYFQRAKANRAGLLTALSNRVGDVLVILGISFGVDEGGFLFSISCLDPFTFWLETVRFLVIASFTKRAQIPFSAWLPAAMSAPTPVSALVHSSTLVTAGVYLLTRFNWVLRESGFDKLVLLLGTLTMLMAGLRAIKEIDIKKIVALSTLRQLGLIIRCLGIGRYDIAYLHLILHAYMKALLFIGVGNAIHCSRDYQDMRRVTLNLGRIPLTRGFMLTSNMALCGLPFLAGFYSKDLWLETRARAGLNLAFFFFFLLRGCFDCYLLVTFYMVFANSGK
jgi:NADH-ubiquinone oxidoreductase chain 5